LYHTCHGLRIERDSIRLACSSSTNRSLSGFHLRSLPSSMAIFPRCPTVMERCAVSIGAAGSFLEITQSIKFRKWSLLSYK